METIEAPIVTETPVVTRTKRNYLRNGKVAPTGAKVFTSEKSSKTYVLKIVGEKRYITE